VNGIEDAQRRLGVPVTGRWDAATTGAAAAYQQKPGGAHRMYPHGKVDPPTLVNLGYYDPVDILPRRLQAYAAGRGDRPSMFFRDLRGASNQVPRWAWGIATVAFGWVAYRAWRKRQRREAT